MTNAPSLDGRRLLVIVPPARFDEAAFYQTWQLLSDEGAWLMLASDSATGRAVGEDGNVALIAMQVSAASLSDFDALVVVGGPVASESLPKIAGLSKLLSQAATGGVPVGVIGGEGALLPAAIQGTVNNLPRFVAELAVQVSARPPAATGGIQIPV